MTGKSTVKEIDRGWNSIVKNLGVFTSLDVFVGIHEGANHEGNLTAAQVGAIHEFGSKDGRIPQRRWLRAGVDYYSKEIGERYEIAFKVATTPGGNVKTQLNRIGLFGVSKVKEYIRKVGQSVWPDIQERTKLAKGSTKILIGKHSQLINGITYTLRPAGQKRGGVRLSDADGTTVVSTVARASKTIGQIRSERRKSIKGRRSERKSATRDKRKSATKRRRFASKLRREDRRERSRANKKETGKRRRFMAKLRKDSRKQSTRVKNLESRKRRLFMSKLRKQDRRQRSRAKISDQKRTRRVAAKSRRKSRNIRDRAKIRERTKRKKSRASLMARASKARDKSKRVAVKARAKIKAASFRKAQESFTGVSSK